MNKKTALTRPAHPSVGHTQDGLFISHDHGVSFGGPDEVREFWMVWRSTQGNRPKVAHFSEESARLEADRLCRKYPKEIFVILRATESFFCPGPGFKVHKRICGKRSPTPNTAETGV